VDQSVLNVAFAQFEPAICGGKVGVDLVIDASQVSTLILQNLPDSLRIVATRFDFNVKVGHPGFAFQVGNGEYLCCSCDLEKQKSRNLFSAPA
jgi:hypothetical protein